MKKLFLLIIALCVFNSCGQDTSSSSDSTKAPSANTKIDKGTAQKAIDQAKSALYDSEDKYAFDAKKAENLVNAYEQYFTRFPNDPKTPEYLFSSGELFRSLKKYRKEIDAYQNIIKNHPTYEKAPQSLFLLGFCYENNLKQLEKAKESYQNFLSKHPGHEMAKAAEFSLKNLGRDPADIIKEFESKNKGN